MIDSDRFGNSFKMFLIVELTKLGSQNFRLDLYSGIFSFENEWSFGTATLKDYSTAYTRSKVTKSRSFQRCLIDKFV
jgi:hypothetical protein